MKKIFSLSDIADHFQDIEKGAFGKVVLIKISNQSTTITPLPLVGADLPHRDPVGTIGGRIKA